MGPEERVRSFYKELMSVSDQESLQVHLSGDNSLEDIELPLENHTLSGIKVISKKSIDESKYFITVDLSYKNNGNLIDVRKVVEVVKDDAESDDWKIRSVENIKTYIELDKSIDIKK